MNVRSTSTRSTRSTSEELGITLDPAVGGLRRQLEHQLRSAVRTSQLQPGVALPSSRRLADDLGVARGVVVEVYEQLTAEGYLHSERGSGTRVADIAPTTASPAHPVSAPVEPPMRFDFRPGWPDLSRFPRADWVAALRRALHETPDAELGYIDAAGSRRLRQELAMYLGRVRGVRTTADSIVVCSGLAQGLGLVATALHDLGVRALGVEDPGSEPTRAVMLRAGLEALPLTVDGQGVRLDALVGRTSAAVLLTPAHEFPMGVVLSPTRRTQLLAWARAAGGVVIEDDYDAEFRYDRPPVGALQGLAPDAVVYAGSASKTLAPGLRLGWMALPPILVEPVRAAKDAADHGSAMLEQLGFAELLASGRYDRHLRRMRLRYRSRRDALLGRIDGLPGIAIEGVAAGLHLVVFLPEGSDDLEVAFDAAEVGIGVSPLTRYRIAPGPPGLVVGYGAPPGHAFAAAVDALASFLGARLAPARRQRTVRVGASTKR